MDVNKFKESLNKLYEEAKAIANDEAIIAIEDVGEKRKKYQVKVGLKNSEGQELYNQIKDFSQDATNIYIQFCNQLNALVTEFNKINPLSKFEFKSEQVAELDDMAEEEKKEKSKHSKPKQDEISSSEKKAKKQNHHGWFGDKKKDKNKKEDTSALLDSSFSS